MSKAGEMFDAYLKHSGLESEMEDALMRACDVDPDNVDAWPFGDFSFDWYDNSFEFKFVRDGWTPTDEHLARCWALGFSRCWVVYRDSTPEKKHELYFAAPSIQRFFPGEP